MTAFSPIDGTELSADPDAIKAFLRDYLRDAIHLVAILPDGPTTGQCFYADADKAADWAASQSAQGKNVYWTVNV